VNISITFRHMDSSNAIKSYAADKIGKLQKFLRQPMTAKVTLSIDRLKHVAETRISSGGSHLEAKEASEDMYASIDRVIDKLERQIRGAKGAAQSKKRRSGDSLRGTAIAAAKPARSSKKKASSKR
jgi:putative sigma-54 modulation protein